MSCWVAKTTSRRTVHRPSRVLEVYPHAAELAVQARQFQARAVTYAAQQGIGQFLDVGCGLPTAPNTHQTAQADQPGCAGCVRG